MKTDDKAVNFEESTSNGCAALWIVFSFIAIFVVLAMACNWANSF